ncbi:MAG: hypothetical protein MSA72_07770 [Lachnospiraceae bacterium]|nr:hypothetical protein [Lachnospiraceae bacterium]
MVCETDSLDRDLQDSITELNIISEQMQIAIAESSLVQEVVVKAKDDIRFTFKNGFEVRV